MRSIKKLFFALTCTFFFIPILLNAQNILKGKIVDGKTRQPIPYANITVAGKIIRTSDKFGNFDISMRTDTAMLTISFVGYNTKTIKVKAQAKRLVIELDPGAFNLEDVVISPLTNNTSFHTISSVDLNVRPVNSSQDLLRLVPGLFIAQHMGGGKAEQIFIRGFDADHGTDVNISVDGLPVNMVSHVHAQGYADMHFLIPETVSTYDFGKGPYYTEFGDFTTAGYINYTTKDALSQNMIRLEAGRFNTARAMAMINLLSDKARLRGENAYIAGEYNYTDGPFNLPEHYKRFNIFGKYNTMLGAGNKLSLSASTFSTSWKASGEIPVRAINDGIVDRFGAIDSLQGGNTHRTNASVKLTSDLNGNLTLENQAYYTRYNFFLNVNSTFYAEDPENGDAVRQHEDRDLFGYNGRLIHRKNWTNSSLTSVAGAGLRFDRTYNTQMLHVNHDIVLDTVLLGNIKEHNINAYLDESYQTGKWLFNAGIRADQLNFNYQDQLAEQMPSRNNLIISPKFNIQYSANSALQLYLKTGKGFHSNDTRAVIFNNGLQTLPSAYGTDLGFNWKPASRLYINAALWYLYLQQEFSFTDDGGVEPGGRTRRMGADMSARYQLTNWLFADLNINLAKARLVDSLKGSNYVALAPSFTSTGGLDFRFKNGINGGISYRYMHRRPGNNDYSLVANGYYVTDLALNYTQKRYEIGLSVENLFNTKWDEFSVEEVTRLKNEPEEVDGMSITPGTPFFAKLKVSFFF